MENETLIIIYRLEQVEQVVEYIKTNDATVISLDFWVQLRLESKGIKCRPLTDYCPSDKDYRDLLTQVQDISREWYRIPEMAFFEHRGLRIGESVETDVFTYLQEARYYLFVFEQILKFHPTTRRIVVPCVSGKIPPAARPFTASQIRIIETVGEFFATKVNIEFKALGEPSTGKIAPFPQRFYINSLVLRIYNFVMFQFSSRDAFKIYVSDYWKNIELPIQMINRKVELIFVDRKELRNISFRNLWKYRIRFMHPLDTASLSNRTLARRRQEDFSAQWSTAKKTISLMPGFSFDQGNWWNLVQEGFSTLVEEYAERIVSDIESIQSFLEKEAVDRVLVRASVSAQHHFFILSVLPRRLGVASLELQHGIGVGIQDPNSVLSRLYADYIAAYGPLVKKWFVQNNYDSRRILSTGSPRFDHYISQRDSLTSEERSAKIVFLGLDPSHPIIFSVVQEELIQLMPYALSSYEVRDYFHTIKKISDSIPNVQFILKFRSASLAAYYRPYCEKLFSDCKIYFAITEDPYKLSLLSTIAYSCYSTLAVETLVGGRPVLLYPVKTSDVFFKEALEDGMIKISSIDELHQITKQLLSDPAYYAEQVERGKEFIKNNFTFDDGASARIASLIQELKSLE